MDVPGVGIDQHLNHISLLDILQIDGNLVLLVSEIDQQIEKTGFVLHIFQVGEDAFDDEFLPLVIIFPTRKVHYNYSIELWYFFLFGQTQLQ